MNDLPSPGSGAPDSSAQPASPPPAVPSDGRRDGPLMPPPPSLAAGTPATPPGYPPQGYQPYPSGTAFAQPVKKSGTLLAGGIVAVVLALFIGLAGFAIVLLGDFFGNWDSDIGGVVILLGLAVLAFAAFGLAAGIGAILRRGWGKVCTIVFGAVNGVISLASFGSDDGAGGSITYLVISLAIVVLGAIGKPTPVPSAAPPAGYA